MSSAFKGAPQSYLSVYLSCSFHVSWGLGNPAGTERVTKYQSVIFQPDDAETSSSYGGAPWCRTRVACDVIVTFLVLTSAEEREQPRSRAAPSLLGLTSLPRLPLPPHIPWSPRQGESAGTGKGGQGTKDVMKEVIFRLFL
uniref:Uncharacterized protein n=1 Tax=Ixodes ricinus TaxID=34613 RepID=A0A147BUA8_IXORI